LHAPAWRSLAEFVRAKTTSEYYGEFGFLDVATLLAGARPLAWLLLMATITSAVAFWRERRERALPILAGCVGPGLVVAAIAPYGDAYAYARYVLPCSVPVGLLLGYGIAALLARIPLGRARSRLLTAVTAALLATSFWLAGPYGVRHVADGPYANSYSSMLPLPAFDRSWPGAPAFYARLAREVRSRPGRVRVIESPALATRTRFLYRNYFLTHRAKTLLGVLPGEFPAIPDGPYVSLAADDWRERAQADYLILHLSIEAELMRYWRFVYAEVLDEAAATAEEGSEERAEANLTRSAEESLPRSASATSGDATRSAYMERHARFGGRLLHPSAALLARLQRDLGKPIYRDDMLMVWALGRGESPGVDYSASRISR